MSQSQGPAVAGRANCERIPGKIGGWFSEIFAEHLPRDQQVDLGSGDLPMAVDAVIQAPEAPNEPVAPDANSSAPDSGGVPADAKNARVDSEPSTVGGLETPRGPTPEELDLLGSRICAFASRMASATCLLLLMIAEFDRNEGWTGFKSCAHWLSWACGMSPGSSREHVRVSRALVGMPIVRERFAQGNLSYSKVRELTRVQGAVDEQRLVDLALVSTASQLQRGIRNHLKFHPDRLRQELRRRVRWFTDDDGSVVLSARLPAEEGAAVIAALESARHELETMEAESRRRHQADRAALVTPEVGPVDDDDGGELESLAAGNQTGPAAVSNADVLLHLAGRFREIGPGDATGTDRHLVVVHVDAAVLADGAGPDTPLASTAATGHLVIDADSGNSLVADRRDLIDAGGFTDSMGGRGAEDELDLTGAPAVGSCHIAGVGGVEARTAARIACDAVILTMTRGRSGAVLEHGRQRRLASAAQRRALAVRDGGCRYPGCWRTTHLEAHHAVSWAGGGPTDLDNLVLLCRHHHMAVHEGGVQLVRAASSRPGLPRWRFVAPDGIELLPQRAHRHTPYRADENIMWLGLDRVTHWDHPEATAIRAVGGGVGFNLADLVEQLFVVGLPVAASEAS